MELGRCDDTMKEDLPRRARDWRDETSELGRRRG